MSTHPNLILMVAFTPDDLTRKTLRNILAETNTPKESAVKIGDVEYNYIVMESDYDDGYQISGKEGQIIFHDYLTYGYGDIIKWESVELKKVELENWAKGICERHNCKHEIFLTANYW